MSIKSSNVQSRDVEVSIVNIDSTYLFFLLSVSAMTAINSPIYW